MELNDLWFAPNAYDPNEVGARLFLGLTGNYLRYYRMETATTHLILYSTWVSRYESGLYWLPV